MNTSPLLRIIQRHRTCICKTACVIQLCSVRAYRGVEVAAVTGTSYFFAEEEEELLWPEGAVYVEPPAPVL